MRKEVDAITSVKEGGKTVALDNLKDLPILASIIQEALRYRSCGIGAMMVLRDTVLENKYHLKEGSFVMFDNRSLHLHKSIWGYNSEDFDMYRFVQPINQRRIQRSGAFRDFGGGANLCLGKDFATLEVMALVAMLVARFDMISDEGRWSDLQQDLSNVSLVIASPKSNVYVRMIERESRKGVK